MVERKNTDNVMHQLAERSDTITLTDYRDAVAKSYHQQLLELAEELIKEEKRHRYSLAVIVAHMACEMAVERVMVEVAKGTKKLQKSKIGRIFRHLRIGFWNKQTVRMSGYNIGSPRNRVAYTKLTGDKIQQEKPMWDNFKKSVTRRNKIVHTRTIARQTEAQESLKATEALIEYLKQKHNMPWN